MRLSREGLHLKRILTRRSLNRDPAQFRKLIDTCLAAKAAIATAFHTAKRHLGLFE